MVWTCAEKESFRQRPQRRLIDVRKKDMNVALVREKNQRKDEIEAVVTP